MIKCREYRCLFREAKWVDRVSYQHLTSSRGTEDSDLARLAICSIHKGGKLREKYGPPKDFRSILEFPDVIVAIEREDKRITEYEAEQRTDREAARYKSAKGWAKSEWEDYAKTYTVQQEKDYADRVIFTVRETGSTGEWDASATLRIEDSQHYDDIPAPFELNLTRGSTDGSANIARAIAECYIMAAAYLDRINQPRLTAKYNSLEVLVG